MKIDAKLLNNEELENLISDLQEEQKRRYNEEREAAKNEIANLFYKIVLLDERFKLQTTFENEFKNLSIKELNKEFEIFFY